MVTLGLISRDGQTTQCEGRTAGDNSITVIWKIWPKGRPILGRHNA